MGGFNIVAEVAGAGGGSGLTFGEGFNVNGNSVSFALDDPSNMLFDPGFEDSPALAQWSQQAGAWTRSSTIFFQGLYSAAGTVANSSLSQTFHCDPNDQFVALVYARTSSGATGSATLRIKFFDATGAFLVDSNVSIPASTAWLQFSVSSVAPSNAATVSYVLQLSGLTGTFYFDNCSLRRVAFGNNIAVGVINNAHLVSGTKAVVVTNGLPSLPSANYPIGIEIFNTFDGKLYRNKNGAWAKDIDPQDLIAGTIAAGVVYAGQINAAQVNAGLFNGLQMHLDLNGITTNLNNAFDNFLGDYAGISISKDLTNQRSIYFPRGVWLINSTNNFAATYYSDPNSGSGNLDLYPGTSFSPSITLRGSTGIISAFALSVGFGGLRPLVTQGNWAPGSIAKGSFNVVDGFGNTLGKVPYY